MTEAHRPADSPPMDADTRRFVENATLLFIASRNAEGAMDVSPRGGQPGVLRVAADGRLLLPDYQGNRRLDTIGNLLADPAVGLAVLNRGCDSYLRIAARAELSLRPEDIAAFPADENPPIGVMVLRPRAIEFVASAAFARAGLWGDGDRRKPPLDLGAIVRGDKQAQAAAGFAPVVKDADEERLLARAGVRAVYGVSSEGVQKKVSDIAGPGGLRFLEETTFVVVAHEGPDGEIAIDLSAEAPLSVIPFDNRHAYRLTLPPEVAAAEEGECALATVAPGRNELLRINGRFERADPGAVKIVPREVYFHCSAAFSRSRIWQEDRRSCWSGKRRFICVERRRESGDVMSFVLRPEDEAPIGPVLAGQYVTVTVPDRDGVARQRTYSISGRPDARHLRISVRRIGAGGVSDLLHETLRPGSPVLVGVPAGRFVLSSPPGRPVVLVSAGVGVTPLLPMLDELAREDDGREVWFVHAARDGAHHLFAEEARAIAASVGNGRIRLVSCYSRPREGDACDMTGRIDAERLAGLVPAGEADFYICGPAAFMASLCEGLVARGAQPQDVRFEAFEAGKGASFDLSGRDGAARCEVTFARSGRTATWTPDKGSLLDLALESGIDIPYSCRVGDCQSCLQRVASGPVDYPSGEKPVLADGDILLCQTVPLGDVVIEC